MKNKAIEAYTILNQLIGDFLGCTQLLKLFGPQYMGKDLSEQTQIVAHRVCMSHLIMTLAKFSEFYKNYRKIIPQEQISSAKVLVKEIETRGVIDFRNKVVGHIWDKDNSRPLTKEEIEKKLNKIRKNNHTQFILWVNSFGKTKDDIITFCTQLRDNIKNNYEITDREIFN